MNTLVTNGSDEYFAALQKIRQERGSIISISVGKSNAQYAIRYSPPAPMPAQSELFTLTTHAPGTQPAESPVVAPTTDDP